MRSVLSTLPNDVQAQEAAELVAYWAEYLSIEGHPPSVRTLRLWRSKGWLRKDGRRLTRRNLLEVLGIMRLADDGVATGTAAQRCSSLDDERLTALIVNESETPAIETSDFAKVTLDLLAQGVADQYHQVERGEITGFVKHRRLQVENPPIALRQAMARLGRLYLEDGAEDRAASVHLLLEHCMTPLSCWAPSAMIALPGSEGLVLIDPEYRVPSEDCAAILAEAPGSNQDDLVERRLHNRLFSTISQPGVDVDRAYTVIREFIARHPLATTAELRELGDNFEIPDDAFKFVQSLYNTVHADHWVNGRIDRCCHCSAPLDRNGRCFLRGCREDRPKTEKTKPVEPADANVAQAAVLKYWIDPAREELRLFDALRNEKIDAHLYPHSDRCDVSIGEEVGVDIKDYRDPASLARRLNRDVSGLMRYPSRRIVAIADRRVRNNREYIPRLKERLMPGIRESIDILSVEFTIRELTKVNR